MIKIFLESDKFSHKAGVTKHATNSLTRKSQLVCDRELYTLVYLGTKNISENRNSTIMPLG